MMMSQKQRETNKMAESLMNESDDTIKWNVVLGNELRNDSGRLTDKISEYHSKFVVLYSNKTYTDVIKCKIYMNGGYEYYGNVGSYDIEIDTIRMAFR